MSLAIRVEEVGKQYRYGVINRRMLYQDVQSFMARLMGREDPNAKVSLHGEKKVDTKGGKFWALKDVSFDVKEGEVVGIIGTNGAGKSTLLKILSEITAPTKGRVLIKGKIASLLEVGTGFHPELTGRENVYLNGAILGMSTREVDAKYDQIAEFSGVEEFLETPVKRYSSGMRVRLAFAVAAHLDPEILIVDEVLSVGDAAFRQKCVGKLGEVAGEGRTVLFVSHNMAAVQSLCTRGIVLENGCVTFDGSQTEAIEVYLSKNMGGAASDLSNRQHDGSGVLRVTKIEFRSESGATLSTLSSGQPTEIWFHYKARPGTRIVNPKIQITVQAGYDVSAFYLATDLTGAQFGEIPESGAFVARLDRLSLPRGNFSLSYWIRDSISGFGLYDAVSKAVDFVVEGGDFFGTGISYDTRKALTYADGSWRLEGGDV